jgi:hypothetical protein
MWLWTLVRFFCPKQYQHARVLTFFFFRLLPFSMDVFYSASMDSAVVVAHAELPNPHLWGLIQPQSKKCNEEFRP